jgi:GntR family transcriptional repressor for pyruvate dehydrogenase complex
MAREKVATEVARRLMRDAAARHLMPGDRLAAEHEIITQLGVARGSVREALRLLESQGAVGLLRGAGGGATISMPRPEQLASSIALALQLNGGQLRTVIEARNVIAPTMAALAAQRATPENVKDLQDCVAVLQRSIRNSETFHFENRRFHDIIAVASGNVLLAVLMPSLSWMSAAIGWELPEWVRSRVASEKAGIAASIEAGDSWLASERMRHMIMNVEEIERKTPNVLDRPIVWADVDELLHSFLNEPVRPSPNAL